MQRGVVRGRTGRRSLSTSVAGALAGGLVALGLAVPATASAVEPAPATLPDTVSADALPTVQTNGVVWSMVTVGDTVYATGSFDTATPPGGGAGVPRGNLLAFDIRTGELIPGFDHVLNGQGRIVVASPDGSRVYVGGDFTTVDGIVRSHVAAFDVATGELVADFAPSLNRPVYAIADTGSTVYLGGTFTAAGGQTRTRLAAFSTATGALTPWAPTANHTVRGIVVDPTGTRVVLGGQFSEVNGITAYSLASVDTAGGDARSQPWGIDNHGDPAGAWSLKIYDGIAYASVYAYRVGNVEGVVAFDPTTLDLVWMNDCHGDPYDTWSDGTVAYNANHVHDCETAGSFPDPSPRTWQRASAMTVAATGTLTATTDVPRYTSWEGRPSPTILHFWPTLNVGTWTGQSQGPWSVTGAGDYVAYGGEFTSVNGQRQLGLTRFAKPSVAPNDRGPEVPAAQLAPTATSTTAGTVTVAWPSSYDMDDEFLTYELFRDGESAPVHTATTGSAWWNRPTQQITDTVPAGSTASYRVTVSDPFGNSVTSSPSNQVTVATRTSAYATEVLADGPAQYWRLGESSGTTAYDHAGTVSLTAGTGVGRDAAGAVRDDGAVTTDGSAAGLARTGRTVDTPDAAFSVEAWVRTTSTDGGVVAQFADPDDADGLTDRTMYVDAEGRLSFGVSGVVFAPKATITYRTVRSTEPVNDGQWHHVAATLDGAGTTLFVDGEQVAADSTMIQPNPYGEGSHWAIGSGRLAGWPDAPASASLAGAIDEVAIYPTALPADRVAAHVAAARATVADEVPTASFTAAAAGLDVAFDASASADVDGTVDSYAWDFGDGTTGTGATASHTYAAAGTYAVTLTVTDDAGATGTTTQQVFVSEPPAGGAVLAEDAFGRTVSGGLGTADLGGPWSASAGAGRQSVEPGTATLGLPTPGNNTGAYLGGVSATDVDLTTTFSVSSMPTGGGTYVYLSGRRVAADLDYRPRLRLTPDGQVAVALSRLADGEAWPGGEQVLPGLTFEAGTPLTTRVVVTGTSPTQIALTVWRADAAEPAAASRTWTDDTAALQAAGAVGISAYLTGSSTSGTAVRLSSFRATAFDGAEPPAENQEPTAAFTATPDALTVAVDGSASADADGTVGSYAWDFGDGGTGTGATASHTYAAPGTYEVTLTVTDDAGATGSTSRQVTVEAATEPPPPPPANGTIARDTFDRTVSGGLGSADVGGPWTASAGATRQSVAPGTATLALPRPGNNTGSYLGGVSATDVDMTTTLSVSSMPTGGGTFVYLSGRRVAADLDYRPRLRLTPDGEVAVALSRLADGQSWPGGEQIVPGLTFAAGTPLTARVVVTGTSPTQIALTVWPGGTPEPGTPTRTWSDDTTALQVPGSVGLHAYLTGSSTAATAVLVSGVEVVVPALGGEEPPPVDGTIAADAFDRTVSGGLGTADVGGPWSVRAGGLRQSVSAGTATLRVGPGNNTGSNLAGVAQTAADVRTTVSLSAVPTGGSGAYVYVVGRRVALAQEYAARVRVLPDGRVGVSAVRFDGSSNETVLGAIVTLPGVTYTAGTELEVRLQVTGTAPTNLAVTVWPAGTPEPATPTVTATDDTPALQAPGGLGLAAYLSGSATAPVDVRFTAYAVRNAP